MFKVFMLLAVLVGFSHLATAGVKQSQAETKAALFELNRAEPEAMRKHKLGSLIEHGVKRVLKGYYDFAVSGGASGAVINLRDADNASLYLPKGAIVSDCLLDFRTAFTSLGSATISWGTGQSASDLKSALAVASATGLVACTPVGSAATAIKMTADRTPTMTISVAALTAGKVSVLIEYWLSDSP